MRKHVPGVYIPDEVVERLRKTPKEKKRAEGKRICVEIIQQVREIEGVAGVHVMAFRQEKMVAEIIEEAGLLPRPRQVAASDVDPLRQDRKWRRDDN
jgi:methylenetetrahydrofolate reductase (NADPH)